MFGHLKAKDFAKLTEGIDHLPAKRRSHLEACARCRAAMDWLGHPPRRGMGAFVVVRCWADDPDRPLEQRQTRTLLEFVGDTCFGTCR